MANGDLTFARFTKANNADRGDYMAAIMITNTQSYIGTAAQFAALSTDGVKAGATFIETDNSIKYIWDGSSWNVM